MIVTIILICLIRPIMLKGIRVSVISKTEHTSYQEFLEVVFILTKISHRHFTVRLNHINSHFLNIFIIIHE